jgi:hypothetical protein
MINGALKLYNGGVLTLTGFLSWRKALTFQTRGYCYWWEDNPIRQFVLFEKDFGWTYVWELNPEGLKASATRGVSFWLKALPLFSYTLTFALQR